MSDLGPKIQHLVELATKGGKDWQMREAVYYVLQAFDADDEKATKSALKALGDGIKKVDTERGEQILLLALGALVESGAPPELAWPAAELRLAETLNLATEYAQACVDEADEPGIEEAVRIASSKLPKKMPRHHAAWQMLKSRCLTAVACLSRSAAVRKKARASKDELIKAAAGLDDLIEPVTFVSHALKLIDDVPLLVLHPDSRRGWRMVMNDVSTNLEMFVLLLDELIGDPKKGMLAGARPNPKAVAVVRDPTLTPKKTPEIKVFWNLVAWTGVLPDGTLPDPQSDAHAYWVWLEGVPIDIPIFEGERVILFQPPVMIRSYEVEPAFSALSPRLDVKSKVPAAEVDRLMAKMAKAAATWRAKKAAADAEAEKKRSRAKRAPRR